MRTPSTDIFGPVEENNDENIEKEVEGEEEEPKEEEEKEKDTGSSEEEGEEDDDDEPGSWSPVRQKGGQKLKETYLKEVQQFLNRGKSQHYAENVAFNALLPVSGRGLGRTYLNRLKWTHHIKHGAIHRKVMKTLRRFIEEDDMDLKSENQGRVA